MGGKGREASELDRCGPTGSVRVSGGLGRWAGNKNGPVTYERTRRVLRTWWGSLEGSEVAGEGDKGRRRERVARLELELQLQPSFPLPSTRNSASDVCSSVKATLEARQLPELQSSPPHVGRALPSLPLQTQTKDLRSRVRSTVSFCLLPSVPPLPPYRPAPHTAIRQP